jgi:hypothetical protein
MQIAGTGKKLDAGLLEIERLARLVETDGACALPGSTIKYDRFMPLMERAVERGYVSREHADFVAHGLRWGFTMGIDVKKLHGKRAFKNYKSAEDARPYITKAVRKRVSSGKTVCVGAWDRLKDRDRLPWMSWRIFPMGAVPKPLEPEERRPISDHTISGLKEVTDTASLRHSLDAYNELAEWLKPGYFMSVMDVDAAFLLLPLAVSLWPFFLFAWYTGDEGSETSLFMHLFADFGAAGVPGTFKIFFTDVVVGIARSEMVLTLPMVIYVDDMGVIGDTEDQVNAERAAFADFTGSQLGVYMKELKDRTAALVQLMIGFWWDSIARTRSLEERKFKAYVDLLFELSSARVLSLKDMQSAAGKMQRAVLTLPPGAACFLANLFALMRGLSMPWQRRRVPAKARSDFQAVSPPRRLPRQPGAYGGLTVWAAARLHRDTCAVVGLFLWAIPTQAFDEGMPDATCRLGPAHVLPLRTFKKTYRQNGLRVTAPLYAQSVKAR